MSTPVQEGLQLHWIHNLEATTPLALMGQSVLDPSWGGISLHYRLCPFKNMIYVHSQSLFYIGWQSLSIYYMHFKFLLMLCNRIILHIQYVFHEPG